MTTADFEFHRIGLRYKLIYSICGLVLGLTCILSGLALCLTGVTGNTKFVASALGLRTELTDATPGVVVFVVGIFMAWITRFTVKHFQIDTDERGRGGTGASDPQGPPNLDGGAGPKRREKMIYYHPPPRNKPRDSS